MKITLIPTGGLCNRMWAMASAFEVTKRLHTTLHISWNRYEDLNAQFADLFDPINISGIELTENTAPLYNINRRLDYYKRWPLLRLHHTQILFEPSLYDGNPTEPIHRISARSDANVLIICGRQLFKDYDLQAMFVPKSEIRELIDKVSASFADNTIGIHIRRTDNKLAWKKSPNSVFHDKIQGEINRDSDVRFYLATDDEAVKHEFSDTYGERIITLSEPLSRATEEGMRFAVADLFLLSRTRKIIGSFHSSYSEVAAQLGRIKLEYALNLPIADK